MNPTKGDFGLGEFRPIAFNTRFYQSAKRQIEINGCPNTDGKDGKSDDGKCFFSCWASHGCLCGSWVLPLFGQKDSNIF